MNGDYGRQQREPEPKKKEPEPLNKCKCINPVFRARYNEIDSFTVRDMLSGKVFILCPKCWRKLEKLSNFQIVAYPREHMKARQAGEAAAFKVPF